MRLIFRVAHSGMLLRLRVFPLPQYPHLKRGDFVGRNISGAGLIYPFTFPERPLCF